MAYSKPNDFDLYVGSFMKKARIDKGYTFARFAEVSGIPHSTYYYYEAGFSSVPYSTIIKLCKVLDIDLVELTEEAKKYL